MDAQGSRSAKPRRGQAVEEVRLTRGPAGQGKRSPDVLRAYYGKRGVGHAYDIFRSRGFSPDWVIEGSGGTNVSMADLPPFLRTLLVTDGTVTKSLEAFYWEPVAVEPVFQAMLRAEEDIDWLGVRAGDDVIGRRVELRGRTSGTVYTRACSVVRPGLIPDELRVSLLAGALGIGELIRDCGLETYRELIEIGATDPIDGAAQSYPPPEERHIYRTYRIVLGGKPAILVTEHFPLPVFAQGPSPGA